MPASIILCQSSETQAFSPYPGSVWRDFDIKTSFVLLLAELGKLHDYL